MVKQLKRIVISCLILWVALGTLPGCEQNDGDEKTPVSTNVIAELYFINGEYARTGDEALDHYLTEDRELQIPEGENAWIMILDALKTVDPAFGETAVSEDALFRNVYVSNEDDTLMIVDLESIGPGGGSMQEGFFIGQIVETILNNRDLFWDSRNAEKVLFLLKGESVDSLMGHFDAGEPFYRYYQNSGG